MDAKFEMREAVRWSYRLFLEREPENEQVIAQKLSIKDIPSLRREFMVADEFRRRPDQMTLTAPLDTPRNVVERIDDAAKAAALTGLSLDALEAMTAQASDWSDDPRLSQMPPAAGASEEGYAQASDAAAATLQHFAAQFYRGTGAKTRVLELGAGAGGASVALAKRYGTVHAVAESPALANLISAAAPTALAEKLTAASYRDFLADADGPEAASEAGRYDLMLSLHALHLLAPPAIETALRTALARLAPGGLALFQLPTLIAGYAFRAAEYQKTALEAEGALHALPQERAFELLAESGCAVLAAREDPLAPHPTSMVSTVFVARKTADG